MLYDPESTDQLCIQITHFKNLLDLKFMSSKRPLQETLSEVAKKYGDVMTIWAFNKPIVFLSSMRAIREAYPDMADRPSSLSSKSCVIFKQLDLQTQAPGASCTNMLKELRHELRTFRNMIGHVLTLQKRVSCNLPPAFYITDSMLPLQQKNLIMRSQTVALGVSMDISGKICVKDLSYP